MRTVNLPAVSSRARTVADRLLIFALVCVILYWGRVILVPLALAVLVSFVLNPLVGAFQKLRLPRVVAVILTMTLIGSLVLSLGWLVGSQLKALADGLPEYQKNIVSKVQHVRDMMQGGAIDRIEETISKVDEEVTKDNPKELVGPLKVKVVPESSVFGFDLSRTISPVINPLASAGLVFILTIFFLLKREDLRDRLVSFAGPAQLVPTIRAINEAGDRISRYLVTQFLINTGYGVAVGVSLYLLGIPYAGVWGLCAGLLRYIPYIGPWASALMPLSVSLITASDWSGPLGVIAVFLTLELISNNFIEPLYYGRSVGISEVAVLIAAVVWAWLWGPVGLVLATPLSVCLVVIGQHVDGLSFFPKLMVSERAEDSSTQLYHRLIGGDTEEAIRYASGYLEEHGWEPTVESLLLPTLVTAKRDQSRGALKETEVGAIASTIIDLIDQYCGNLRPDGDDQFRHTVLVCPPEGPLESAALELAEHTLESEHQDCDIINLDSSLLSSEVGERIREFQPIAVVVASLPPDNVIFSRRWIRMIRRHCPDVYIIAARWRRDADVGKEAKDVLKAAGADQVVVAPADLWAAIAPRRTLVEAQDSVC